MIFTHVEKCLIIVMIQQACAGIVFQLYP